MDLLPPPPGHHRAQVSRAGLEEGASPADWRLDSEQGVRVLPGTLGPVTALLSAHLQLGSTPFSLWPGSVLRYHPLAFGLPSLLEAFLHRPVSASLSLVRYRQKRALSCPSRPSAKGGERAAVSNGPRPGGLRVHLLGSGLCARPDLLGSGCLHWHAAHTQRISPAAGVGWAVSRVHEWALLLGF